MDNLKCVITVGVSASGKSTWANTQCNQEYNWIKIERDDIREFILATRFQHPHNYFKILDNLWKHWQFKNEKFVDEEIEVNIKRVVNGKFNIVFADTNLNIDRRNQLQKKMEELGYEVEIKVFGLDLSLDELWKFNTYRKNVLLQSVINKQYYRFREEFPKYQLKDVSDKQKCIIFDIDGTLATMHNRSPYEWNKVGNDLPNMELFYAMKSYYEQGYMIIIMSGRDSVCRNETIEWLEKIIYNDSTMEIDIGGELYFIDYDLHMRKENDMRKDSIIKSELFFEHVDGNYNVVGVFDDRPSIVRMWQELGLKTYSVGNQGIEF